MSVQRSRSGRSEFHLRANQERQSRNVTNLACVELRLERMFCILPLPANLCERNATLVLHPLGRLLDRFIFSLGAQGRFSNLLCYYPVKLAFCKFLARGCELLVAHCDTRYRGEDSKLQKLRKSFCGGTKRNEEFKRVSDARSLLHVS